MIWPLIAQVLLQGDPLVVKAGRRFAGAISSVTWRNVQYVDRRDHGRELQVAVHVGGFGGGECFNPTEAGSKADGSGKESSSEVLYTYQCNQVFFTVSRMAFWTAPGEKSPGCKNGGKNTTVVSDFVLSKTVTLDDDGLLTYDFSLDVPADYPESTIEAPVLYMPTAFSRFKFFDPDSQTVIVAPPRERRPLAIIASDGHGHAAAMWSDGAMQMVKTFRDTNAVIIQRKMPLENTMYSFTSYIAFGSGPSVKAAITRAYRDRP